MLLSFRQWTEFYGNIPTDKTPITFTSKSRSCTRYVSPVTVLFRQAPMFLTRQPNSPHAEDGWPRAVCLNVKSQLTAAAEGGELWQCVLLEVRAAHGGRQEAHAARWTRCRTHLIRRTPISSATLGRQLRGKILCGFICCYYSKV
jgi:hypothetical protein